MDFTREPIVETIITPREGFRLIIRSSKTPGQEEFVVDALEVVSFGSLCFYRHLERPRSFIVPASDYEVLEIREVRMPLKAASFEGTLRQSAQKSAPQREKPITPKELPLPEQGEIAPEKPVEEELGEEPAQEERPERRRDRKRGTRRRRGLQEEAKPTERPAAQKIEAPQELVTPASKETSGVTKTFLPPPPTLIRDDLDRLRKSEQYRGAFYEKEGVPGKEEEVEPVVPPHLQEEEPHLKPEEESTYKATPLPPEEEDVRTPLWIGGGSLGPDKP